MVPRSSWHPGPPTNNAGGARPRLARPVPTITRHYTGAPPDAKVRFWEASDWMTWFQGVAVNAGKSFEYNYVIPPRTDGIAQVWEYAGDYRAAHSEGENAISVGVLFAIGVTNHPTFANYNPAKPTVWEQIIPPMIDAYRWLRDIHLKRAGIVAPNVAQVEHRNMPGAATACPGDAVIAANTQLSQPWKEEPMGPDYFNLRAAPSALWQVIAPLTAVYIHPDTWAARGNPPARLMSDAEAATFSFLPTLPNAAVR